MLKVTGKYGRERLIPLHPSTVRALVAYGHTRDAVAAASTTALLVGKTGRRLNLASARVLFRRVADQCDLPARPGCGPPVLHDLRHTFAVDSLIDAHRDGVDVDARLAALATYLGHVNPLNTYWYYSDSRVIPILAPSRA